MSLNNWKFIFINGVLVILKKKVASLKLDIKKMQQFSVSSRSVDFKMEKTIRRHANLPVLLFVAHRLFFRKLLQPLKRNPPVACFLSDLPRASVSFTLRVPYCAAAPYPGGLVAALCATSPARRNKHRSSPLRSPH